MQQLFRSQKTRMQGDEKSMMAMEFMPPCNDLFTDACKYAKARTVLLPDLLDVRLKRKHCSCF